MDDPHHLDQPVRPPEKQNDGAPPPVRPYIRNSLWGCLEIPLFMAIGAKRFDATWRTALWSFIIPFLIVIPTAELAHINPDFSDKTYDWIFGRFLSLYILGSLFYFIGLSMALWSFEKLGKLPGLVNGLNWLNLSNFLINLPFFLLVYFGAYSMDEMDNLLIFLIFFSISYQAYFLSKFIGINWMLAASLAIFGLFTDQTAHQIIFGN